MERGPVTDKLSFTVCERVPDVPLKVTLPVAVAAPCGAEKMTCCFVPGVKVKAEGEADTPDGRPEVETLTWPEKPLTGLADTETEAEEPGATEVLCGVTDRLKSGGGGGGGGCEFPPPPPQPAN